MTANSVPPAEEATSPPEPPRPTTDRDRVHQAQRVVGDHITEAQEWMTQAERTLAGALVAFQTEMPKVGKNQTATIPGKDGRSGYSYKYADLSDVTNAAGPVMAKHGLAFTCLPQAGANGYELRGRVVHRSGEFIEGALPIAGRQAQEIGSSLTYLRRYLMGCLLGIVTDEDEDGAIAQASRARLEHDKGPIAARLWAKAAGELTEPNLRAVWAQAGEAEVMDTPVDHPDGARPLRDALTRLIVQVREAKEQGA